MVWADSAVWAVGEACTSIRAFAKSVFFISSFFRSNPIYRVYFVYRISNPAFRSAPSTMALKRSAPISNHSGLASGGPSKGRALARH